MNELEKAWSWREAGGLFKSGDPIRVFHGPSEGAGPSASLMIDRFGEHYWVTEREGVAASDALRAEVRRFLESKGARSAVFLARPERGVPEVAKALFGDAP